MALGKKTGGRKKGVPNKLTQDAREAMQEAFNGVGGVRTLIEWGNENLTEFFKLWGRTIPNEQKVAATHGGKIEVVFRKES